MPSLTELLGEAVRAVLGPGEDEGLVDPAGGDELAEEVALALAIDADDDLADEVGGRVPGRHLDHRRVAQEGVGEALDLVREGRREEEVLALARAGSRGPCGCPG